MLDTLILWYLHCDRHPGGIVVPRGHMEHAIRALAKRERFTGELPFETGADYEKRMQCSTQKV